MRDYFGRGEITFLFPLDGDCLNSADGKIMGGRTACFRQGEEQGGKDVHKRCFSKEKRRGIYCGNSYLFR